MIEKLAALITAAFGLIAALAWNTALQELFAMVFGDQGTIVAMFIYAVIVTIIAVLAAIWIGKLSQEKKEGKR